MVPHHLTSKRVKVCETFGYVNNTKIVLILNCEVKSEDLFYFEVPIRNKVYML